MNVSVIISVFNIGKYLVNNLESMIEQVGEDIEFIYINDGSTDDSLQILNKYKDRDHRIKVISQENEGLSVARNRGLQEATGEIVIFVDGDDYLVHGAIEILKTLMQQNDLDVLLADEVKVTEEKKEREETDEKIVCDDLVTGMELLLTKEASFTGCNYIYRRSFLEEYHLRFLKGVLHEDMEFFPRSLYYAKRVMKTNYKFYYHVMREGSITSSRNIKRSKDLIYMADLIETFCCENKMETAEREYFNDYICFLYTQGIHLGILNGHQIKNLFENAWQRKEVAERLKSGEKKYKMVSAALRYRLDALYAILYRMYAKIRSD